MRLGMDRREFLTAMVVGAVGWKAGFKYNGRLEENNLGRNKEKDWQVLQKEIIDFRSGLGLDPLPAELSSPVVISDEMWNDLKNVFKNEVPLENLLYGRRVEEIIRLVFGKYYTNLIKGVRVDKEAPVSMTFDSRFNVRMMNIPEDVNELVDLESFIKYVLHECVGHGTDPGLPEMDFIYSYDVLLRVEHGKWKALSQAMKVEGKFLNDKGDLMYPVLKMKVGESVAKELVDRGGAGGVKYNKRKCIELGGYMMEGLRSGKTKLPVEQESAYKVGLERILVEIYAEMVKYAVLYPDQIGYNIPIMEGVGEIISSIRGEKISLDQLRRDLLKPNEKVITEVKKGATQNKKEGVISDSGVILPELKNAIPDDYENLVSKGILPKKLYVSESGEEFLKEFSSLYRQMIRLYPVLKDYVPYEYRTDFDPENLNIWDIREIELAMDARFVRNILTEKIISKEIIDSLKVKAEVIKKYLGTKSNLEPSYNVKP